jgi:hypothetical protein
MRWFILLLAMCSPALAQPVGMPFFGKKVAAPTYVGPGDVVSGATAWYGLRAYNAAYVAGGPAQAINVRRQSDNATQDINVLATGALDTATAATFCAATTCFVTTFYDQSGALACGAVPCDLAQTTAANQPALTLSCLSSNACVSITSSSQAMAATGSITPAGSSASLATSYIRVSGTGTCRFTQENGVSGNRLQTQNGAANGFQVTGASGSVTSTATDNVWHSALGVIAGASSVLNVDNTETTGSVTLSTTSASPGFTTNSNLTNCRMLESGIWDNNAIGSTNRAALVTNAKTFWGF